MPGLEHGTGCSLECPAAGYPAGPACLASSVKTVSTPFHIFSKLKMSGLPQLGKDCDIVKFALVAFACSLSQPSPHSAPCPSWDSPWPPTDPSQDRAFHCERKPAVTTRVKWHEVTACEPSPSPTLQDPESPVEFPSPTCGESASGPPAESQAPGLSQPFSIHHRGFQSTTKPKIHLQRPLC